MFWLSATTVSVEDDESLSFTFLSSRTLGLSSGKSSWKALRSFSELTAQALGMIVMIASSSTNQGRRVWKPASRAISLCRALSFMGAGSLGRGPPQVN